MKLVLRVIACISFEAVFNSEYYSPSLHKPFDVSRGGGTRQFTS